MGAIVRRPEAERRHSQVPRSLEVVLPTRVVTAPIHLIQPVSSGVRGAAGVDSGSEEESHAAACGCGGRGAAKGGGRIVRWYVEDDEREWPPRLEANEVGKVVES